MNKSLWYNDIKTYQTLKQDIKCEVAIIGAGLSGLSTAYYLSKAGASVAVFDKGLVGSGASGHTTAHITLAHDLIYDYYISKWGLDKTKKIVKANLEAINNIKSIAEIEQIDCDLVTETNNLVASTDESINELDKEYIAYQKLGISCSYDETSSERKKILSIKGQMHFNPVKYLNGLAESIIKNGGQIFQDSPVLEIKKDCLISTHSRIFFKKLVVASHSPLINFPGLYFAKANQERSYAVALEVKEKNNSNEMYNNIDENGLTFRRYNDLSIIGGCDHRVGSETKTDHHRSLTDKINHIFKEYKIVNYWFAQDGITIDRLPYIGRYSKNLSNVFVITGFGKWGMTNSNIAGRIISDLIQDFPNEYAEIYSPQRSISMKALGGMSLLVLRTLGNYLTWVFRLNKPTCPHLKCKLKYNPLTNNYDCPCHGSRFDCDGKVLDSPAIHNIERSKK